jgi:hypothetical protein
MKKISEKTTALRVNAKDSLAEISVVDSRFNTVASNLGELRADLPPGIYKLRWSSSLSTESRLLEITGEESDVIEIFADQPAINTSVPLHSSRFGCIDRPEELVELSVSNPILGADSPCQILVFLRDPEQTESSFPVESVTLHTADGNELVALSAGRIDRQERYAGLVIGVDPGVYRLRVDTGPLGPYDMFVFSSEGWQTQIFLTCDDFYWQSDVIRRPSLRTASVLMGRVGIPFNPKSDDARLAELALGALLARRDVIEARDMRGLLYGKFEDPMLGIYGAHLLLLRSKLNRPQFEIVLGNLRSLVGPVPDWQALALLLGSSKRKRSQRATFGPYEGMPPMLVRSWDLMVGASKRRYSVIPSGSIADLVAGSVASTRPWFLSRVRQQSEHSTASVEHVSVAKAKRVVSQMINQVQPSDTAAIREDLAKRKQELDAIESAILDAVAQTASYDESKHSWSQQSKMLGEADIAGVTRSAKIVGGPGAPIPRLDAPSYSIARSAMSLASKLGSDFDIDFG